MASNKTYTVMKDGEVLKELKTLAAAKKLADTEDAEVFCGTLCVYAPDPDVGEDEESAEEVHMTAPVKAPAAPEKYTLTAKMNIRRAPSLDADKVGVAQKGAVVKVATIKDDWMHLTDGTFILYGAGKFAVKD